MTAKEIQDLQITRVRKLLGKDYQDLITDQEILIVLAWQYPTEAAETIRRRLDGIE